MTDDIRKRMFAELEAKAIFSSASQRAMEYADNTLQRNVFPTEAALAQLNQFDQSLPEHPGNALEILTQLDDYGSPATIAQTGGRYFGLVNGGALPVTLAVRWLTDFWDQNTPLYLSSPIASKLELVTEKWLIQLFGLPESTVAGYVSGSSMSILCGLAAARFRIFEQLGWNINGRGFTDAPQIRVIASEAAHGTVTKAIALLGFGVDNIERVAADAQGRIKPEALPTLDDRCIIVLQAGNVNSGAFDDFEAICSKARTANAWVHVDGAFGLWAAGSQRLKYLTAGIELADSWSFDGHKTLNTPYDSGVIMCRDRDALVNALHVQGAYIVYSDQANGSDDGSGEDLANEMGNELRDGMLHTPEMSRRARICELWAALKYLGQSGIDDLVSGLHQRALQFATELTDQGFEIVNEVVFNQILVALETDDLTDKTIQSIQQSGECWVGGTQWHGRKVIRISICSWVTTTADVSRSVNAFVAARKSALNTLR